MAPKKTSEKPKEAAKEDAEMKSDAKAAAAPEKKEEKKGEAKTEQPAAKTEAPKPEKKAEAPKEAEPPAKKAKSEPAAKTEAPKPEAKAEAPKEAKSEPAAKTEAPKPETKAEAPKEATAEQPAAKAEASKPEEDTKEKVNDKEEEEEEDEKEAEQPELETDAPADNRKKVNAADVAWSTSTSTLNVVPMAGGAVFTSLSEGGTQYLLAGVRATCGVKAGRYMFETRIIEKRSPEEGKGSSSAPEPRQLLRVGLSLAGSSIFLGDTQDSVCFDSEGFFLHGKKKTKLGTSMKGPGCVAVVVNLDKASPNANTISLFKNGERLGKPVPIPEELQGKALFPTITYRNIMVETNFGPAGWKPLPFKCRMLQDAAADDVVVSPDAVPKDGKFEVLYPVGLPGAGVFEWVDDFLSKNPGYTELSDRKILEWAVKSGMHRPKNVQSMDKPTMTFGLPLMDDMSVRRLVQAIAPTSKRNFVVGELKANLVKRDREHSLANWAGRGFKTTAAVLMGEPPKEYKDMVHALMLDEKTKRAELDRNGKVKEVRRKKLSELRKKQAEAKKAKDKKENDEDAPMESAADVDIAAEAEAEVPPVKVELTEEELKLSFRKRNTPDISEKTLTKAYANFALPEEAEGFSEIRYVWQPAKDAAEALRKYMFNMKLTQKVEDLQPGAWFKEQSAQWTKTLSDWKKKQSDWKEPSKRKALIKKLLEEKKANGNENATLPEIDMESLDVAAVEDVTDIGSGEPLFANFEAVDWALASHRYEMHLLFHAFRKDLADPDRPGFSEAHLGFYYNKYWKKNFSIESFSLTEFSDFCEILKDVFSVGDNGFLLPVLAEDAPLATFLKATEAHRRDRVRRVEAGDETALLKFKPVKSQASAKGSSKGSGKDSSWGSRGGREATEKPNGGKSAGKSRSAIGKAPKSWGTSPRPTRNEARRPPPRPTGTVAPRPTATAPRKYADTNRKTQSWPPATTRSSAPEPAWKRPRTESWNARQGSKGKGGGGKGGARDRGDRGIYYRYR